VSLLQRLQRCSTIALDTVTFIYHFEDNPVYAPLTQIVFDCIEAGTVQAVASTITAAEVLTGAKKAGGAQLVLQYRALFAGYPNLVVAPVDMLIAERASDLRCTCGLKLPDAIAAATAIVHGAQILVTNDRGLTRVGEIDIVLLADYVGG
jgi:predicted nucleic acid-binding protein